MSEKKELSMDELGEVSGGGLFTTYFDYYRCEICGQGLKHRHFGSTYKVPKHCGKNMKFVRRGTK